MLHCMTLRCCTNRTAAPYIFQKIRAQDRETQNCSQALTESVQGLFSSFAQGDLPYASGYWTNDYVDYSDELPAWPMRAACELLADPMDDASLIHVSRIIGGKR